jgi:hypothetical protein
MAGKGNLVKDKGERIKDKREKTVVRERVRDSEA